MNEELAARYADDLRETIGHPDRMISFSKSGYGERHPDHVAIFNANLCVEAGKVWWGDLDLTLDEPKLAELARRVDSVIYVLHESAARFRTEDEPLLERAVFSVTPSGHTRFQWRSYERAADGSLRLRPIKPGRRLMLVLGRPRLLRFWRLELRRSGTRSPDDRRERTWLLYIGARDGGLTPLLVIALTLFGGRERGFRGEWTWYPTDKRHAPRPLLRLDLGARHRRRLRPFLSLTVHPGFAYTLVFGLTFKTGGDW